MLEWNVGNLYVYGPGFQLSYFSSAKLNSKHHQNKSLGTKGGEKFPARKENYLLWSGQSRLEVCCDLLALRIFDKKKWEYFIKTLQQLPLARAFIHWDHLDVGYKYFSDSDTFSLHLCKMFTIGILRDQRRWEVRTLFPRKYLAGRDFTVNYRNGFNDDILARYRIVNSVFIAKVKTS